MADVLVFNSMYSGVYQYNPGLVWTSPLIGYWLTYSSSSVLRIYKTTDGGASWSLLTSMYGGTPYSFSWWFDKWTSGDTGTLIHFAYWGDTTPGTTWDGLRYRNLNTSTDTLSSTVTIRTTNALCNRCSIVKSRGGYLYIASTWPRSVAGGNTVAYVDRSVDGGVNWTARTTFQETTGDTPADYYALTPGNEADPNDIYASYIDVSADAFSLYVYDDSANSWAETVFDTTGITLTGNENFIPMVASVRHSDGHTILAVCTYQNNAAGDIRVYDINGASVITAKTDVLTNALIMGLAMTIDQNTDDLYVMYGDSSGGVASINVYYKKSSDGGVTWEAAIQLNFTARAFYAVSADPSVGTYEGRLMPIFYDATNDDAYVNFDNAQDLQVIPGVAYNLEVDWDGDGDFGDANENVTADLLLGGGHMARWERGVDDELGVPITGTIQFDLLNTAGKYTPDNTASVLYPNMVPYRRMRLSVVLNLVTYELFNGYLYHMTPHPRAAEQYTSCLGVDGLDILSQLEIDAPYPAPPDDGALEDSRIGVPTPISGVGITFADANPDTIARATGSFVDDGYYDGITIDILGATNPANNGRFKVDTVAISVLTLASQHLLNSEGPNASVTIEGVSPLTEILDKASWSQTRRTLDRGDDTLDVWWTDRAEKARAAMEKLMKAEQCLIYIDERGYVIYEARSHRQKDGTGGATDHLTPQKTFNDNMITIDYDYSARPIHNQVRYTGSKLSIPAANAELYSTLDRPLLGVGITTYIWAVFAGPVASAVEPISGADWGIASTPTGADNATLRANVGINMTLYGAAAILTFTNANGLDVYVVPGTADPNKTLIVNGKLYTSSIIQAVSEDSVSQAAYFVRTYSADAPFQGSYNVLKSLADYVLTRDKNPQPENLQMCLFGTTDALLIAIMVLRISDRIRVTAQAAGILGISARDYFINKMTHELSDGGKKHEVVYRIALASTEAFWILGVAGFSEIGETTKLGL